MKKESKRRLREFAFVIETNEDGTYITARDKFGEAARFRLPVRSGSIPDSISFTFSRKTGAILSVILDDND